MLQFKRHCDMDITDNELLKKVREHIGNGTYRISRHALEEMEADDLTIPDIKHVLINGRRAKEKDMYSNEWQGWKYAIQGKTMDNKEIRVIVAFEKQMLIITVFKV
jgi:hypothetical protein